LPVWLRRQLGNSHQQYVVKPVNQSDSNSDDAYARPDANAHSDPNPNSYADSYSHANADTHANADADPHTDNRTGRAGA